MNISKQILEAVSRGIKLALDDYQDIEPNSSISQSNDVIDAEDVIQQRIVLDEYTVDLGLPSKTRWAKYNLGVNPDQLSKPEDWYGDYYAWGETIPNKPDGYNWETYQFNEDLIKYNEEDNLNKLQLMDDAAYQNMHLYNFKFKMPTKEQFEELLKYTTNYLVKNYDPNKLVHNTKDDGGIQGLNGRVFKGKNGNELFMPAVAYSGSYSDIGIKGRYWSSSLNTGYPSCAWILFFYDEVVYMLSYFRYSGCSIRPVSQ